MEPGHRAEAVKGLGIRGDVFGKVNLRGVKSCLGESREIGSVTQKKSGTKSKRKSKKKNVSFEGRDDRVGGGDLESADVYPRLLREFNARQRAGLGGGDGIWNQKKIVNTKISLGDVRQRMQQAQELRKGMDQVVGNV